MLEVRTKCCAEEDEEDEDEDEDDEGLDLA
jgi:hypothetical protein